jgi:ferrous iron transport protein B
MAARTIENEADRRMTIMLSTFIPCSAKSVIIGMVTASFFPDSVFIAPAMYFLGIAVIVLSGIALKKTEYFSGEVAPFVMELPAYHMPSWKGLMIHMWERSTRLHH